MAALCLGREDPRATICYRQAHIEGCLDARRHRNLATRIIGFPVVDFDLAIGHVLSSRV